MARRVLPGDRLARMSGKPSPPQDPLERYGKPLVAVLIAVMLSLFVAALIGGNLPLEYKGRALAYVVLVLYVLVGGFVVFWMVADGEQSLRPARLLMWIVSLWMWPVLAALRLAQRRREN